VEYSNNGKRLQAPRRGLRHVSDIIDDLIADLFGQSRTTNKPCVFRGPIHFRNFAPERHRKQYLARITWEVSR